MTATVLLAPTPMPVRALLHWKGSVQLHAIDTLDASWPLFIAVHLGNTTCIQVELNVSISSSRPPLT